MDSITRFAMAKREIGLSLGKPLTSKGLYAIIAKPIAIAYVASGQNKGLITAFFTVRIEGDDLSDPIADQSRSILRWAYYRELGEFSLHPPINIYAKASRITNDIIDKKHSENAIEKMLGNLERHIR